MTDIGILTGLLLLGGFLLSSFFSGSEAALLSVQRHRIQHLAAGGSGSARRVARMVAHPDRLLPPILLGNNLVNTAVAALGTSVALQLVANESQALLLATVVVTGVVLVFGETIPKTLAARHAERISQVVALPLELTQYLLLPVSLVLQRLSGAVLQVFGGARPSGEVVTEEEIRTLVSLGQEIGAVPKREAEMIQRVFEFADRLVREVMTPRPEMISVPIGTSFRDFLALYDRNYHTRFPVYDDDPDDMVGLISVKDVLRALAKGRLELGSSVTTAMRQPMFVPETKRVQELFDEMRAGGHQMAIVVDEFGAVAGLVTLKRLIESIVGPVGEEGVAPEEEVVALGENSYGVDADLPVDEVNQRMGLDIPLGNYDTLAGFILEKLGRLPQVGDQVAVGPLSFHVLEMRGLRIHRVLLIRQPLER